jgi:uncharacterized RDD family membrane protein YckC
MSTADGGTSSDASEAFGGAPADARSAFGAGPERPAFLPPQAEPARRGGGAAPANWWPRVGATVLDQLVVVGVVFLGAVGAGVAGLAADAVANAMIAVLVVFVFAYPIVMLTFHDGQTVGKQVARVRVLRRDGEPVGFGRAFVREVTKILFGYTGILWLIDVLWPLWQAENKALHDLIAGTRVVAT